MKRELKTTINRTENRSPFTHEEIRSVITNMSSKKSPGEDGLTADICFQAYTAAPDTLLAIYNACLKRRYFPKIWKRAIIRVIPKPGRANYTDPKSYRPIGLLPIFGKVLEKMITNRLTWQMGKDKTLSSRQYGFVPQRSTEDALYDAVQLIRDIVSRKNIAAVVSLDIEGAFDNAWWPAILSQLHSRHNVSDEILGLLSDYLNDRSVKLQYLGEEILKRTNKGCIQGSTCGPTLWNVLIDSLLRDEALTGVHLQAYADDILIIVEGKSGEEISSIVNDTLKEISKWGKLNKLRFAPLKTQAIVVTRKLNYDLPQLEMNGIPIVLTENIKVLGLYLDNNLNFIHHLDMTIAKVINIYKSLSRAAKSNWGLNTEILHTIYISVIEPIILYSASVWAPIVNKKGVLKRLDRTTRMFGIQICKAHKTTSTTSATLLGRILPLDLRAIEQLELYEAKRGKHLEELPGRQLQTRISAFDLPHPASRKLRTYGHINDQNEANNMSENKIMIYTDGSKLDGRVGAAFTIWKTDEELRYRKFGLADYCSVYQAELVAINKALQEVPKTVEKGYSVCVASDSRSALDAISNPACLNPIVHEIQQSLTRLETEGTVISLQWIKAHAGILGNERADVLAKEAATKSKTLPAYDRYPLSYTKNVIRDHSVRKWQYRYEQASTGSTTKMFFPSVASANRILKKMDMNNITAQTLTGHGGFRAYLHKFKLIDDPTCNCDSTTPQTLEHIILECPKFERQRYDCEYRININIEKDKIPTIMMDDESRKIFMEFTRRCVVTCNRENKSTVVK